MLAMSARDSYFFTSWALWANCLYFTSYQWVNLLLGLLWPYLVFTTSLHFIAFVGLPAYILAVPAHSFYLSISGAFSTHLPLLYLLQSYELTTFSFWVSLTQLLFISLLVSLDGLCNLITIHFLLLLDFFCYWTLPKLGLNSEQLFSFLGLYLHI